MNYTQNIRALALPSNEIGVLRYKTYKDLIDRMRVCITQGYYLEAIALQESIIADRLESRLKFLTGTDKYSFKHLEILIKAIKAFESDTRLRDLVVNDVDTWRDKRNKSLHQMAKIEQTNPLTWGEKLTFVRQVAEEGSMLFREVVKAVDHLK